MAKTYVVDPPSSTNTFAIAKPVRNIYICANNKNLKVKKIFKYNGTFNDLLWQSKDGVEYTHSRNPVMFDLVHLDANCTIPSSNSSYSAYGNNNLWEFDTIHLLKNISGNIWMASFYGYIGYNGSYPNLSINRQGSDYHFSDSDGLRNFLNSTFYNCFNQTFKDALIDQQPIQYKYSLVYEYDVRSDSDNWARNHQGEYDYYVVNTHDTSWYQFLKCEGYTSNLNNVHIKIADLHDSFEILDIVKTSHPEWFNNDFVLLEDLLCVCNNDSLETFFATTTNTDTGIKSRTNFSGTKGNWETMSLNEVPDTNWQYFSDWEGNYKKHKLRQINPPTDNPWPDNSAAYKQRVMPIIVIDLDKIPWFFPNEYNIYFDITNGTGTVISQPDRKGNATIQITPNSNATLPTYISVQDGSYTNYNSSTGRATVYYPRSQALFVKALCPRTFTFTSTITNGYVNGQASTSSSSSISVSSSNENTITLEFTEGNYVYISIAAQSGYVRPLANELICTNCSIEQKYLGSEYARYLVTYPTGTEITSFSVSATLNQASNLKNTTWQWTKVSVLTPLNKTFSSTFTSNGQIFNKISHTFTSTTENKTTTYVITLSYENTETSEKVTISTKTQTGSSSAVDMEIDSAYRTITFDDDLYDADIEFWLKNDATQQ